MQYLTPLVGDSGQYIVTDPFDKIVLKEQTYTCIAIKSLADIVAFGQQPYEKYWEPYGIERSKFELHAENAVNIIVLRESTGRIISVPNSYIKSIPFTGGVEYANMILGVELGVINVDTDLTLLKFNIQEMVKNYLGVSSVAIKPIKVSTSIRKTEEEDRRIRIARKNRVNETMNLEAELIKKDRIIEQLKKDLITLSERR